MQTARPLIVTLAMDDPSFGRLDGLRRRHFPAERNFLPAHVTLFHHLPGDQLAAIRQRLQDRVRDTAAMVVQATGLIFLGRGVAIRLASPDLDRLRASLADGWSHWLTPQDRQLWRPHVTVQNKARPDLARELHAELTATFRPFAIRAPGLLLWRYDGGPWLSLGGFQFGGSPARLGDRPLGPLG